MRIENTINIILWRTFHPSKEYLNYCLKEINTFLKDENLQLNNKTRVYKSTNNFVFLGRDANGRYGKYRYVNRRLKNKVKKYRNQNIKLSSLMGSMQSYNYLIKRKKYEFRSNVISYEFK